MLLRRECCFLHNPPVIKDYALSWMLKALNDVSEAFALKGGMGIRKAYIEGYRFSVNLDFTLTRHVDVREALLDAVRLARRESGIEFGEDLGLKSVRTGYEASVMFRLYYRFPMKIKIDVTTPENEVIALPLERRKLIHPHSDECDALTTTSQAKTRSRYMVASSVTALKKALLLPLGSTRIAIIINRSNTAYLPPYKLAEVLPPEVRFTTYDPEFMRLIYSLGSEL